MMANVALKRCGIFGRPPMLSNCFPRKYKQAILTRESHCLWVTEPCVNALQRHGGEKITRWNKFNSFQCSGNIEINKSASQMSNKILEEDGVSKAAWLLQLHRGTLSAVAVNVFQTLKQFLRALLSLATNQTPIIGLRQTHSRVGPKVELKQSTNIKGSPYGKGTWRGIKWNKKNICSPGSPGGVKAVSYLRLLDMSLFWFIWWL